MGMTRKLLSISTAGAIDFRSDKERIARSAKKTAKELKKQTKLMKRQRGQE